MIINLLHLQRMLLDESRRDVPRADGREGGAAAGFHSEARAGGEGDRLPRGVNGEARRAVVVSSWVETRLH